MITLCCAPDWMKGGEPGFTNWSRLEVGRVYIGLLESAWNRCVHKIRVMDWFCVTQGLLWLVFRMTEEVKDDIFGLLVSCFHFSGGSFSWALHWLCHSPGIWSYITRRRCPQGYPHAKTNKWQFVKIYPLCRYAPLAATSQHLCRSCADMYCMEVKL